MKQFAGGYVGVDVFFVISGFLITGLLLREDARNRRDLDRGVLRAAGTTGLLPAATLVLIVGTVLMSYQAFGQLRGPIRWAGRDARWGRLCLGGRNFRSIQLGTDYLQCPAGEPSPLQHFWSLAVEEQFYFVWPVLLVALAVLARRLRWSTRVVVGWGITLVTAASLFVSLRSTDSDPVLSYMATHTRAWQFGVGAIVAVAGPLLTGLMTKLAVQVAMWVLGWAGFAAVLVATVTDNHSTPYPGWAALVPTLGAGAIIVAGQVAANSAPAVGWFLSPRARCGG